MSKASRKTAPAGSRVIVPPATTRLSSGPSSWIGGLILLIAVGLAWSNSFSAPFELDDHESILTNSSIRRLGSLDWLSPPATGGETVSGRPVLNFTFALNYAIGGTNVRGYHGFNVLLHALSAGLLFGLVRRTMDRAAGTGSVPSDELARRRSRFIGALAIALIWALHPLQTGAVTYIVQRAESLAGFFLLLTLYSFVRASTAAESAVRGWSGVSVGACLLGMATKETMVTAPLLVLLYDRTFLAGSFRAAWRARARVYTALSSTWLLLAALVVTNRGRGGSAGLAAAIDPWTYFVTQCAAIVTYLRLTVWPAGQVFDYGVATVDGLAAVLPQFLLLSTAAALTVWALRRNRPAGFLAAACFLILAPSSSVVPVATQTMAEHRMYVALAPLVLLGALAVHGAAKAGSRQRMAVGLAFAIAAVLGATTYVRNQTYRSELALWSDTVAKRPDNPRARNNLGRALMQAGREREAEVEFRRTIELQPNHALAHFNLGTLQFTRGETAGAEVQFRAALIADPHYSSARLNLGQVLHQLGRKAEAAAEFRRVLADDPNAQDARTNLAAWLIDAGELAEADALLRVVLAAEPGLAEAHYHLGRLLEKSGRVAAAETEWSEALRLKPTFAPAHLAVANRLAQRSEPRRAEAAYREALRLNPRLSEAYFGLGNVLAKAQRFPEAISAYREALTREPDHVQARNNLANAQLVSGQLEEAVATYERILAVRPTDVAVRRNWEVAQELLREKNASGRRFP